jgi:hypothetical protein
MTGNEMPTPSKTNEMVEVDKKYLEELERDSKILGALYAGGVDNWEWYGDALESLDLD